MPWEAGDRVPYQLALRVIGAELDDRSCSAMTVVETLAGFVARFRSERLGQELGMLELSAQEIARHEIVLRARRRGWIRKASLSGRTQGRYQDLLRALGHELEDAGAYSVLIDEVESDLLVTYQYLRPEAGFVPLKRLIVLNPDAQETLLREARARRGRD